jgi:hypothetical protein
MIDLPEKPTSVRYATPSDEDALIDFLRVADRDNGFAPTFDEPAVRRFLKLSTAYEMVPGAGIIGIVDGLSEIKASLALVFDHFWSAEKDTGWYLQDRWCYVREAYRDEGLFEELMAFAKYSCWRLSRDSGRVMPVTVGIMTKDRMDAKVRLYRAVMPQIGASFFWVPPHADGTPREWPERRS